MKSELELNRTIRHPPPTITPHIRAWACVYVHVMWASACGRVRKHEIVRRGYQILYYTVRRQMAGPCVPCWAANWESGQRGRTTSLQHDGMLAQEAVSWCLVLRSVSMFNFFLLLVNDNCLTQYCQCHAPDQWQDLIQFHRIVMSWCILDHEPL